MINIIVESFIERPAMVGKRVDHFFLQICHEQICIVIFWAADFRMEQLVILVLAGILDICGSVLIKYFYRLIVIVAIFAFFRFRGGKCIANI